MLYNMNSGCVCEYGERHTHITLCATWYQLDPLFVSFLPLSLSLSNFLPPSLRLWLYRGQEAASLVTADVTVQENKLVKLLSRTAWKQEIFISWLCVRVCICVCVCTPAVHVPYACVCMVLRVYS